MIALSVQVIIFHSFLPSNLFWIIFYSLLFIVIEFAAVVSMTIMLIVPTVSKTLVNKILRAALCFVTQDNTVIDVLVNAMCGESSYKELSFSDIICGLHLNSFLFHFKQNNLHTANSLKSMLNHEYLQWLQEGDKEPISLPVMPSSNVSEDLLNELEHFSKYANAVYGMAL